MQSLIRIVALHKAFGPQPLFEGLDLTIHAGDCFALIGENGSGKTTLLDLIEGSLTPDSGTIQRQPALTIGLLPQEVTVADSTIAARSYLLEGPLAALERQLAALQERLDDPSTLALWAELHEEFERCGGYRRPPLEEVLHGLQIDIPLDTSLSTCSSGERVRFALAKALLDNPDLLLLDEPTNHLDATMLAWLQAHLQKRVGATVIVSHDRAFLNAVCNRLLELRDGRLTVYGGSYNFYLTEQERLLAQRLQAYEAQQEERAALKQRIRATTFANRKHQPPSDRNIMAYDHCGEQHQKSIKHTLDVLKARLEAIEANPIPHPLPKTITGLHFASTPLASTVALELDGISKAFGDRALFADLSRVVHRGDRLVLMGRNGAGKTTLLRCMAGLLDVDAGVVRRAPAARIAYLDQEVECLSLHQTALEYFEGRFHFDEEMLRRELHKAALGGAELLQRPLGVLSVGQRKRLMLLSLILERPNVLLLDEPTNHLDLLTLEALEKALLQFEGAIVAVSHDRTFIDKVATEVWHIA